MDIEDLSEKELFDLLDQRAKQLKDQFDRPLSPYLAPRYALMAEAIHHIDKAPPKESGVDIEKIREQAIEDNLKRLSQKKEEKLDE